MKKEKKMKEKKKIPGEGWKITGEGKHGAKNNGIPEPSGKKHQSEKQEMHGEYT